jgi:hypothetical protein
MSSSNKVQHFSTVLSRRYRAFVSVLKTHGVQLDSAAIKRSRNAHTRQILRCALNLCACKNQTRIHNLRYPGWHHPDGKVFGLEQCHRDVGSATPTSLVVAERTLYEHNIVQMLSLNLWDESCKNSQVISCDNWDNPNQLSPHYFVMVNYVLINTCLAHICLLLVYKCSFDRYMS